MRGAENKAGAKLLYGPRAKLSHNPKRVARTQLREQIIEAYDQGASVIDPELAFYEDFYQIARAKIKERLLSDSIRLSDREKINALVQTSIDEALGHFFRAHGEYGETLDLQCAAEVVGVVSQELIIEPDSQILARPEAMIKALKNNWQANPEMWGDGAISEVLSAEYDQVALDWLKLAED